jgi:preprotein translocase SecE subunit
MARDRQRAKQRRRARQPGSGGPVSGSGRARARDSGLEPTDAELDNTAPPEPTKHSMPHVEEARMAEAGAEPALEPGDGETDPAVAEERERERTRRGRGGVIGFLGHVIDELRRVQWPDRRQTGQGTAVTLGFVIIAGGFLGLMDAIWKPLVEAIL